MADTIKISALPVVTTSAAADSIPIVQGGVTSRIHPGPAGGLDADTVSGAGIGVNAPKILTNLNTAYLGGNYYYAGATATGSPNVSYNGNIDITPYSSTLCIQKAHVFVGSNAIKEYIRILISDSGTWFEVFNTYSDGNLGAQPAPKPTASTGTPGRCVQGGTTTPTESGTYLVFSFKTGAFYAFEAGVPNSTDMNTRYSTTGINGLASWRTA